MERFVHARESEKKCSLSPCHGSIWMERKTFDNFRNYIHDLRLGWNYQNPQDEEGLFQLHLYSEVFRLAGLGRAAGRCLPEKFMTPCIHDCWSGFKCQTCQRKLGYIPTKTENQYLGWRSRGGPRPGSATGARWPPLEGWPIHGTASQLVSIAIHRRSDDTGVCIA